jgi:hypothetical protein
MDNERSLEAVAEEGRILQVSVVEVVSWIDAQIISIAVVVEGESSLVQAVEEGEEEAASRQCTEGPRAMEVEEAEVA